MSLNPVKDDAFPLAPAAQVFHMTPAAEAWEKKSLLLQELAIPFPACWLKTGVRHILTAPLSLHWQHTAISEFLIIRYA